MSELAELPGHGLQLAHCDDCVKVYAVKLGPGEAAICPYCALGHIVELCREVFPEFKQPLRTV